MACSPGVSERRGRARLPLAQLAEPEEMDATDRDDPKFGNTPYRLRELRAATPPPAPPTPEPAPAPAPAPAVKASVVTKTKEWEGPSYRTKRRNAIKPHEAAMLTHVMRRAYSVDPYDREPPSAIRPPAVIFAPRPPATPKKALPGTVPRQTKKAMEEAEVVRADFVIPTRRTPTPPPPQVCDLPMSSP